MKQQSWTEIQALAVRAASGAGVPPSQALAFGAMLPRHLADGSDAAPLARALREPDIIIDLAHRVERMIEMASLSRRAVAVRDQDPDLLGLLVSWLASLPCHAEIETSDEGVNVCLSLLDPSTRARPDRIGIAEKLLIQMQELAARTYVADSDESRAHGAGAGLMDLD